MSIAHDIGHILENNSLGELGTDLFISQMPDSPDSAVAIYETGGGEYNAISELHTGGISIRSRANDYESAYSIISNIANFLGAVGDESYYLTGLNSGIEEDGTAYLRIKSICEPYPVGRDSSERVEFAQSFTLTFSKS